jgi:hypothetical protein
MLEKQGPEVLFPYLDNLNVDDRKNLIHTIERLAQLARQAITTDKDIYVWICL